MIKKIFALSLSAAVALSAMSCGDPEDLVTEDAKAGGLVVPVDDELSYVTGATIDVAVVPTVGIKQVKYYKTFSMDGEVSAEVLAGTVDVAADDDVVSYTADYASLKNGIAGLPDTDAGLVVGDFWSFRVVAVLEDGREVQSAVIKAIVDNPYSGDYETEGTIVRETSPGVYATNEYTDEKALSTIDGNTCQTFGALGWFNNPTIFFNLTVNEDNTVTIEAAPDAGVAITPTPGKTSTYDPEAKVFTLYYQYANASGLTRVITETVTRVE
ncbi:BT_3044 domain-containing protein [Pseudochryseolinea flava]|nr:DUF4361 domain-containing protein [Pseudochryseolinea flava]